MGDTSRATQVHWLTFVLIPEDTLDVTGKVTELLSPSPGRAFPEYPVQCSCVGWAAISDGLDAVDANPDLHYLIQQLRAAQVVGNTERLEELVRARIQAATEIAETHPNIGKPDPNCDVCEGTGTWKCTRNPASHWDYWRIGGRWDGVIVGMPRRVSTVNSGEDHERLEYNSTPVRRLPDDLIPHALVTPDGLWYEDVNWASTEEEEREQWEKEARGLLNCHQNCLAIAVDCHF